MNNTNKNVNHRDVMSIFGNVLPTRRMDYVTLLCLAIKIIFIIMMMMKKKNGNCERKVRLIGAELIEKQINEIKVLISSRLNT